MSHRPRKRFSQNFLHDQSVLSNMCACIAPQAEDHVVEIGPGQGALTAYLYEAAAHLSLVEIDNDLAALLQQKYSQDQVTIYNQDVLTVDFSQLVGPSHRMRIVGNLPYHISTPLLFHVFKAINCVQDMHFLLQKEVVDRLCASVNTRAYGRLSVMAQYYCACDALFEVPPEAFYPAPKVQSAYVRLVPHKQYHTADFDLFADVVRDAFCHRRKTIANGLKKYLSAAQLDALAINPSCRPQELTVAQYLKIVEALV